VASSHERKRADRLMQRAYAMFESGYREEALRLASVAAELENSQLAVYKRGEERPSDFVEFLLAASSRSSNSTAMINATRSGSACKRASKTGDAKDGGSVLAVGVSGLPLAARDLKPATALTPRFAPDDNAGRAAANAGQEVAVAKDPQNPNVSVVTAEASGANADETATGDESQSVVAAERVEDSQSAPPLPGELASNAPEAAAMPDAADVEPLADADGSAAATSHSSSQLTIVSLVGLLIGVAGMLGLAWWRRQERQHYAGGK
jgi:hypothetical protein